MTSAATVLPAKFSRATSGDLHTFTNCGAAVTAAVAHATRGAIHAARMLATSLSRCCKKPARRPQFWTIGLPALLLVSAALGFLARRRDWLWTFAIVPAQVT